MFCSFPFVSVAFTAKMEGNLKAFMTTAEFIYLHTNQLDALNFMSLFHAFTCFEHMCSSPGGQNCTIQPMVSSH